MSNGFDIITSCPKRWQSAMELLKLLSETMRCVSFELLDDPMRACGWWCFNEEVHMVGHYLKHLYFHLNLFCFLFKELLQSFCCIADKNLSAIFRTPDNVVSEIMHCCIAVCPPLACHRYNYIYDKYITIRIHPTSKEVGFLLTRS